jgi:hypothetical protein
MNLHVLHSPASRFIGRDWSALFVFLVVGFALRIAFAIWFPRIHHPDETYQILEQAYSFYAEGTVVPWEYHDHIRSWLWPILVAIFAYPAEKLFGTAFAFKLSAQILCSLVSLCAIWAAWSIGRLKSEYHAWIGGLVATFWFEFVYFAPLTLMDVVSAHVMLAAIAFLMRGGEGRQFLYGGFLLALTFVMRVQLAPALLVIAFCFCKMEWRSKWVPLILGGIAPVIIYGLTDWVMLGVPFISIYNYFVLNFVRDIASAFGVSPYNFYLQCYIYIYGYFFILVFILLTYAMLSKENRYLRPILLSGIVIIFFHSLIPHKEYRFIYSATLVFLVVVALSSTTLFLDIFKTRKVLATGLLSIIWLAGSGSLFLSKAGQQMLYSNRPNIEAFSWITKQHNICGIGIMDVHWSTLPASVGLHKPIPIYPDVSKKTDGKAGFTESYNLLLANDTINTTSQKIPASYLPVKCFSAPYQIGVCVYKREGTCTASSVQDFNSYILDFRAEIMGEIQ